jgi:hypothetical protein
MKMLYELIFTFFLSGQIRLECILFALDVG